jgi:predicted acetyltransferase
MLILEFPNEKHRAAYEDMVHGWRNVETPTSPGKLFTGKDFDEFLLIVQGEPTESDPAKVPAHLFLLADTESSKLFGAIQIRHHINHPNLIVIPEAKKIGLSHLLVTCKDANVGSRKVIESNGGVFERTTFDEGQLARRYWIKIG